MEVLRPTPSTAQEMTKFHSNDYVAFMQNVRCPALPAEHLARAAPAAPSWHKPEPEATGSERRPSLNLWFAPAQVTPDNYQDAKFGTQLKRFSVGEDCPVFDGLYKCAGLPLLLSAPLAC